MAKYSVFTASGRVLRRGLSLEQAGEYVVTRGGHAYELSVDVAAGWQDGRVRYELRRSIRQRSNKLVGMRRTGVSVWAKTLREALKSALEQAAHCYEFYVMEEDGSAPAVGGLRDQQHQATGSHHRHDSGH